MESLGEVLEMSPYEKNFEILIRAREVIGPEVEEERITWRKG